MPTETVALTGELDFATAFEVEMRLERAIAKADKLIVDLSGLEFIDSTGIRALLEASRAARLRDVSVEFVPGPDAVQRTFAVAGLLDELPFSA